MYTVSDKYKAAANSKSRNVTIKANFKTRTYNAEDDYFYWQLRETHYSYNNIISLKIVEGQTTGAFHLGDTICPVLDMKLSTKCTVYADDLVEVFVSFDNGGEWQQLVSDFLVDSVEKQKNQISFRAYGTMLILSKFYDSKLTYSAKESAVLNELLEKNNIGAGFTLLSDATISEKPVKGISEDEKTVYYTRREMIGFLAAANGGSAYINNKNQMCFSTPRETGETFTHELVISENISAKQTVSSIQWNTSGLSYSLGDNYDENSIEFYNPIVFSGNEQILSRLQQTLVGLEIDGAIIKKNGCGYFEIGDKVTYIDLNSKEYHLLVMGIVYEFTNSYFSETLYSLTNTKNQRNYAGQQVISNQIGGGAAAPLINTATKLQTTSSALAVTTSKYGVSMENTDGENMGSIIPESGGLRISGKTTTLLVLPQNFTVYAQTYNINIAPTAGTVYLDVNDNGLDFRWSNGRFRFSPADGSIHINESTTSRGGTLSFKNGELYAGDKRVLTEE